MDTAVLFLVFNRPDTTRQVFEAIRQARPPRLYLAADGPRAARAGEAERCAAVRAIVTAVDWPCEVHTLFRDTNLGCRRAVSSAIDWFFGLEPEGIVLEDDVLPEAGFFGYCEALLARYRDDPRVMSICGSNFAGDRIDSADSYLFSAYNHVWGWASWRRAWQHYDVDLQALPAWLASGALLRYFDGDACTAHYWHDKLMRTRAGLEHTWDYQWQFTCWRQDGLCVLPRHNLITNLGIGADATHPVSGVAPYIRRNPARPIEAPLRHPAQVARDRAAEAVHRRHVIGLNPLRCLKRALRRLVLGPPKTSLLS